MGTIRSILAESGLPVDDFGEGILFLAAESDGEIVGTIALEPYPPLGLLRSAAVRPALRDRGVGALLVDALVREARGRSLGGLVLLTTTAERFFARMGFERIDRDSLAGPILSSGQFAGARCSSAAVMRLALD
jgi:amino-acid N-acetyltransferase